MMVEKEALKQCHYCGALKPLEQYPKDSKAWDGRRNKCKDCIKAQQESPEHKERTRLYDQARAKLAKRRTENIERQRERRQRLPERKRARDLVARHLTKQPCVICGNPKSEGHHEDYDKPLDVVWLCRLHHRLYHEGRYSLWPKS